MNDLQKQVLTRMITDFKTTYACFLLDHQLRDSHVARAAFYVVCEDIVRRDPVPDEEMQEALEKHLEQAKILAVEGLATGVEITLENVAQTNIRR